MNFYPVFFYSGSFQRLSILGILGGEVLGLCLYFLQSSGLFYLSSSRGLRNAWFSWIPVLREFQLGSLADQYQYVVKSEIRSRRWVLLILSIVKALLALVTTAFAGAVVFGFFLHGSAPTGRAFWQTTWALRLLLPIACLTIWQYIARILSLYDIYRSCAPENAALFTVLGILFPFLVPLFLFCNRKNERGMPPRKENTSQY